MFAKSPLSLQLRVRGVIEDLTLTGFKAVDVTDQSGRTFIVIGANFGVGYQAANR